MRDGITVGNSAVVNYTVVTAGPPITWRFLRGHMQGGCPTTRRWADDSQLEHVVELATSDLKALWSKAAYLTGHGWTCCPNVLCDMVQYRTIGCVTDGNHGE